jgi:hypothetical protein
MRRMVTAGRTEFFDLQPVLVLLLVLGRRVIAIFTFTALERYDFAHRFSSLQLSALNRSELGRRLTAPLFISPLR